MKAPLCADCIGSYGSERVGDGLNVVSASSSRVYRGGSFDLPAAYARSTHRDAIGLAVRADYLGLRPARLPSARLPQVDENERFGPRHIVRSLNRLHGEALCARVGS